MRQNGSNWLTYLVDLNFFHWYNLSYKIERNINFGKFIDKDEDYKKMRTKKVIIEPWEDSKCYDEREGLYEWWYFDMIYVFVYRYNFKRKMEN